MKNGCEMKEGKAIASSLKTFSITQRCTNTCTRADAHIRRLRHPCLESTLLHDTRDDDDGSLLFYVYFCGSVLVRGIRKRFGCVCVFVLFFSFIPLLCRARESMNEGAFFSVDCANATLFLPLSHRHHPFAFSFSSFAILNHFGGCCCVRVQLCACVWVCVYWAFLWQVRENFLFCWTAAATTAARASTTDARKVFVRKTWCLCCATWWNCHCGGGVL